MHVRVTQRLTVYDAHAALVGRAKYDITLRGFGFPTDSSSPCWCKVQYPGSTQPAVVAEGTRVSEGVLVCRDVLITAFLTPSLEVSCNGVDYTFSPTPSVGEISTRPALALGSEGPSLATDITPLLAAEFPYADQTIPRCPRAAVCDGVSVVRVPYYKTLTSSQVRTSAKRETNEG